MKKILNIARKNILNTNMLLSKNPDRILKNFWPAYFSKAKGYYVWDYNNIKYLDMLFAVGQSNLGYSNNIIDTKVIKEIKNGNMCSLNSPFEVELSKKLLKIHKWANFVKFAKSGGETNAIAVRIARANAKKKNIAICGYHGWHDWFMAANLSSKKNLDNHLFKNLIPVGIHPNLKNTVFPFKYNNLEGLKILVKKKNNGIIQMEVKRFEEPKDDFLQKIRSFCTKKRIILIFDECTSGFRENYGGLHLKYKVYPDIVTYGKAIGNGYPITAVLCTKKLRKKAEKCFISSTFWTEKSGSVAALETLKLMKKLQSWERIKENGKKIKNFWAVMSKKYFLPIKIYGLDSIPIFDFLSSKKDMFKRYFIKEMLKKKFLATNMIYVSWVHDEIAISKYFKAFEYVFKKLSKKIQ